MPDREWYHDDGCLGIREAAKCSCKFGEIQRLRQQLSTQEQELSQLQEVSHEVNSDEISKIHERAERAAEMANPNSSRYAAYPKCHSEDVFTLLSELSRLESLLSAEKTAHQETRRKCEWLEQRLYAIDSIVLKNAATGRIAGQNQRTWESDILREINKAFEGEHANKTAE